MQSVEQVREQHGIRWFILLRTGDGQRRVSLLLPIGTGGNPGISFLLGGHGSMGKTMASVHAHGRRRTLLRRHGSHA